MNKNTFHVLGEALPNSKLGSMFGIPCYKVGPKPYILWYQEQLVCKLPEPLRSYALNLTGAELFCPKTGGQPMRNWVQLPPEQADQWLVFAEVAREWVLSESE